MTITAKDRPLGREALGRLGNLVDTILDRVGLEEDDLVDEVVRVRRSR